MYKQTQTGRAKVSSPYQKIDPAVLFYLNTSGCRCRAVMAAFMDAAAFTGTRLQDCCDNAIYSTSESSGVGGVPEWSRHGVHASDSVRYLCTDQFFNGQVDAQLHGAASATQRIRTRPGTKSNPMVSSAVRRALDEWISRKPEFARTHRMILPLKVRNKVAIHATSICTEGDLIRILRPSINTENSALALAGLPEMLAVILGEVEAHGDRMERSHSVREADTACSLTDRTGVQPEADAACSSTDRTGVRDVPVEDDIACSSTDRTGLDTQSHGPDTPGEPAAREKALRWIEWSPSSMKRCSSTPTGTSESSSKRSKTSGASEPLAGATRGRAEAAVRRRMAKTEAKRVKAACGQPINDNNDTVQK